MKNRFRLILPILLSTFFYPILIFSQGGSLFVYPNEESAYPTSQEIFNPATATNNDTLNGILEVFGATSYELAFPWASSESLQNAYAIMLTGDPALFKAELESTGYFDLIEIIPNYVINGCVNPLTPNDPGVANWANEVIEVECAWGIEQGDASIVAGVVDTRFDWAHPDLQDKLVAVWGNNTPQNDPHGLGIAGAIGAEANNNFCIAGIGYNTMLAGYVVGDGGGIAFGWEIWDAVNAAIMDGRPVINVS